MAIHNNISIKNSLLILFCYPKPAFQSCSISASQLVQSASDGMRQSPRGDKLTVPTFGPSGKQERLNWFRKKRPTKLYSHFFISPASYLPANA